MEWLREDPALPRRRLLQLGAGIASAALLAACAPSPLIAADPGRSPAPAPTLDDDRRWVATATATIADLAAACGGIPGVEGEFATWCTALAQQHRAHLTVLAQTDPLGGVQADHTPLEQVTAAPVVTPGDQAGALAALTTRELALADQLAPVAARAEEPGMALFWTAQLVAARLCATALGAGAVAALGPAPVPGSAVPAEIEAGTTDEARKVLLSHQQALVFGLQTVLGRIAFDDPAINAVTDRLAAAMRERDRTAAAITEAGGTPPPPAPEYELPGDATDPAQRDLVLGRLELTVMGGWARLAAVDAGGRESATAQMTSSAGRARGHGVALPHWPGWV